jgi:heme A synthase
MLHRYAWFLAIFALAVLVSGAYITSTQVATHQPQDQSLHRILSIVLALLTAGLLIWTRGVFIWIAILALAMDAALGRSTPAIALAHAVLAHFFFAILVGIAMISSPAWKREAEPVDDGGRPLLRPAAMLMPPLVLLQITLGAAYRHDLTGVMFHMAGAMIVVLITVIVSAVVLQNFPAPAAMRRAAATLISLVVAQVCLGIAAFLMLVLNASGSSAFVPVTVGHAAIGAMTLAASCVMAMQVWRGIRPKKVH